MRTSTGPATERAFPLSSIQMDRLLYVIGALKAIPVVIDTRSPPPNWPMHNCCRVTARGIGFFWAASTQRRRTSLWNGPV